MKSRLKILTILVIFLWFPFQAVFAANGYHGLFIGVDKYKDSKITGPGTAVSDAKILAKTFQKKFGFDVKVLTNSKCTKKNIKKSIDSFSAKLKKTDILIIYFSGKGDIDPLYGYGWWLPYDAVYGDSLTYIDFIKASEIISRIKGNVVIITNSRLPDGITGRNISYSKTNSSGLKFVLNNSNADPVRSNKDSRLSGLGFALYSALSKSKDTDVSFFKLVGLVKKEASSAGVRVSYKNLSGSRLYSGDFLISNKTAKVKEEKVVEKPEPKKEVVSYLSIISDPKDAEILINDKIKVKAPLSNKSLSPGKYYVKAYKDGYFTKIMRFTLRADERRKLNISLDKEPPKNGQLYIEVTPSNTNIRFQNKNFKFVNGMSLPVGEYKLLLSSPFYKDKTVTASVSSGSKVSIKESLSPVNLYKNKIGQEFVRIKSGSFNMGSPVQEFMRGNDEALHGVKISKDFFMMKREVTIAQWEDFVKETGYKSVAESSGGASVWIGYKWEKDNDYSWKKPGFVQKKDEPVTCITWHDAVEFAKWLSKKENLNYSLPTEAEWEYACRAGSKLGYAYGACLSEKEANFAANSSRGNCPVGKLIGKTIISGILKANKWGLFDMHGNVMEWCKDWYGVYNPSDSSDPKGPSTGKTKVLRGGAWDTDINNCRAANRFDLTPSEARNNIGFRLVLIP